MRLPINLQRGSVPRLFQKNLVGARGGDKIQIAHAGTIFSIYYTVYLLIYQAFSGKIKNTPALRPGLASGRLRQVGQSLQDQGSGQVDLVDGRGGRARIRDRGAL